MRYLPHTQADIKQMLQLVGAKDLDALFASIPDDCPARKR
jgi:glycine dehydrogenase subunit 1